MSQSEQTAILLIAHGSRRAEANAELVEIARRVASAGSYAIVEPSYMEIAEPSIPDGAAQCIEQGATRVVMMPFFLSAGSHVVDDLERHRRELAAAYPQVDWQLREPLGLHPLMTQIVLDRIDPN